MAAGQPDAGGGDLHRRGAAAGGGVLVLRDGGVVCGVSGPSSSHAASSALALQIFGICLAQNLVSDIEAVQASW